MKYTGVRENDFTTHGYIVGLLRTDCSVLGGDAARVGVRGHVRCPDRRQAGRRGWPRGTLSFYTVIDSIDCHSVGIYILILLPLLSFPV
jgi:hypothetical protein